MSRLLDLGRQVLVYAIATVIVAVWVSPLLITVFTAGKTTAELMGTPLWWLPPSRWQFANFVTAWTRGRMGLHIWNTVRISLPSVLAALSLSSLAAYALSRFRFPGVNLILMVFVAGNLIPLQMLMIPVFRFTNYLGIYNTHLSVIIMHSTFQTGFCTFFLRNFMKGTPDSLFEAARVDGANEFVIFLKVGVPLMTPAYAALGILVFTWVWNDYLWSLILIQSDRLKPVTLGLTVLQGEFFVEWNILSAGAILAAIAPVLVFFTFQKYFIGGLTMGAVKD